MLVVNKKRKRKNDISGELIRTNKKLVKLIIVKFVVDITLPFLLVIIDGSEMEGSNLSFPTTQKSKTPNLKYMGFVYD